MSMYEKIAKLLKVQPNLKGREIAKKLELDKKEVNSFLYKNEDTFKVDGEYKWNLLESDSIEIQLPAKWIDGNLFEDLIEEAELEVGKHECPILFIFVKDSKMLLDALGRFLALCNQLADEGVEVTINFDDCRSSFHYFNRNGFMDILNTRVKTIPDRPTESTAKIYKDNSESVLEFGLVDPKNSTSDLINKLSDKFVAISSELYEGAISTIFSEMINNIVDHSDTLSLGFAGLQKYKWPSKHIQTIISDNGVGIAQTLRPSLKEFYPKLFKSYGEEGIDSDIGLVESVLKSGEVSRYGAESGRGLGFGRSRDYAIKFNAKLSVRQEGFSLKLIYEGGELKNIIKRKGLNKIKGTHICFDFYVD